MTHNDHSAASETETAAATKKMYYSTSEVCAMTDLDDHVLRHWEKEFSKLRPKRNSAGKRAYREKDIELIRRIKTLLYDEKFSIDGAKAKIAEERRAAANASKGRRTAAKTTGKRAVKQTGIADCGARDNETLVSIRDELVDLLGILES
jgi:DNA-binding transcriptional MerR regulator